MKSYEINVFYKLKRKNGTIEKCFLGTGIEVTNQINFGDVLKYALNRIIDNIIKREISLGIIKSFRDFEITSIEIMEIEE